MKWLIFSLLALGCSDPMPPPMTDLEVTWCFDLPEADAPFFQDAMEEWNSKTVTTWKRDESNCQRHIIMVDPGDPVLHGHVGYSPHDIFYQSNIKGNELKNLARHELGHIANLPHSEDQKDIMYPSVGTGIVQLSDHDVEVFFQTNWKH